MLDVDHFKLINDAHGHLAGDHVLAHSVRCAWSVVGTEGLVGRLGGEKFAVLRTTSALDAAAASERLRTAVAAAGSAAIAA